MAEVRDRKCPKCGGIIKAGRETCFRSHGDYFAGYRQGIEDAAKVANDAATEYSASSKQIGDYHHAKVVAANSIAAAICALGKEGK